jgi:hypothetical protein
MHWSDEVIKEYQKFYHMAYIRGTDLYLAGIG